ncbi:MAG TPA: ADP-ribosylglycohydrolase family protein [Gemmataceae bacterium]|jgi:ADP-ribosylglycohydrolase
MRVSLDQLTGVILGTAVGDALGLPREGLSRRRAEKMFGPPPLRHRFVLGRGMVSDDTEHACMTAQALLRCPDDADAFARALAWRLRFWLLGLPAGIGSATLRGILKLWLGFPPRSSGVWSAGNGPAMRTAILGVCLGEDVEKLRAYVRVCTRLTHRDPRAERGALLIALAAHHGAGHGPGSVRATDFLATARAALPDADDRLRDFLARIEDHLERGSSVVQFADDLGLRHGVSGYIYHTVPVVLYAWLRWSGDFRRTVEEVIALGGDADTTGAISGALAGATSGVRGIPAEWLDGICEWPRSVAWMRTLAERLASRESKQGSPPLCWPALVPRNVLFLVLVLLHGFRRLLPPY